MHADMRSVCVYLSSISGGHPAYAEVVVALGAELARRGLRLIYGGAQVGLMGVLANAALAHGGEVIGVIPTTLVQREVAHRGLHALHEVETMHQRKALLAELADGFVVAPGGFGTLEEAFEILTARQLSLHDKPLVLLDVREFWAPLITFLDRAVEEGVLRPEVRALLRVAHSAAEAVELLLAPQPVHVIDVSARAQVLASGSTVVVSVSVEALDLGAEGAQASVDPLVAAVDLADVVDGAGAFGGERG